MDLRRVRRPETLYGCCLWGVCLPGWRTSSLAARGSVGCDKHGDMHTAPHRTAPHFTPPVTTTAPPPCHPLCSGNDDGCTGSTDFGFKQGVPVTPGT